MAAIALAQLIASARSRANMVDSQFVDDATELVPWVNESAAELHDLVVSRFEDDYTVTSDNIVVSSGNTIDLSEECPASAPFYKLRGIDSLESGTSDWQKVRMFNFGERNRRNTGSGGYRSNFIRYRLMGQNIILSPDDNATGTYRLWYIPGYVDMVEDDDEVNFPQNWHEYIIASVAAKCLAKEDSSTTDQLRSKAEIKERVMAMAASRDAGSRMRIEDVRSGRFGGTDGDDDGNY